MKIYIAVLCSDGYSVGFVDGCRHASLCGMIDYDVSIMNLSSVVGYEPFILLIDEYDFDDVDNIYERALACSTKDEFMEMLDNLDSENFEDEGDENE